jgi:hypothetical protein
MGQAGINQGAQTPPLHQEGSRGLGQQRSRPQLAKFPASFLNLRLGRGESRAGWFKERDAIKTVIPFLAAAWKH